MRVEEVSFRVKSDMPLSRLSGKYSGTRISKWPLLKRDLIHISPEDRGAFDEIMEFYVSQGAVIATSMDPVSGNTLITECRCDSDKDLIVSIEGNNHLALNPVVFMDGWAYYRLISFDKERLKNLFAEISDVGQVELQGRRSVSLDTRSQIWIDTLFSALTVKQMDSLIKAHDNRYYGFPRGARTDSIAMSMGMSRQTYEEHLRKAEAKIIEAVVPFLRMYRSGSSLGTGYSFDDKQEELLTPPIYSALARHYLEGMDLPNAFKYHSKQAEMWTQSYNFMESVRTLETCLEILHDVKANRTVDNVQDLEGDIYWKLAQVSAFIDSSNVTDYAQKALEIFKKTGNNRRIIDISTILVLNTDEPEYYHELVESIPDSRENVSSKAHFYCHYAKAISDNFGEYERAFLVAKENMERVKLYGLDFLLTEMKYLMTSVMPINSSEDKNAVFNELIQAAELAEERFKVDIQFMDASIVTEDIISFLGECYFWLMYDVPKANCELGHAAELSSQHQNTLDTHRNEILRNYMVTLPFDGSETAAAFAEKSLMQISVLTGEHTSDALSAFARAVLAWRHVVRGEKKEAMDEISRIRDLGGNNFRFLYQLPLVLMHVERGETNEASLVLKNALDFLGSKPLRTNTVMYSVFMNLFLSENSILRGDLKNVAKGVTRLREIEGIMEEDWITACRFRAEALVMIDAGDYAGAAKLLELSSSIWEKRGIGFWQGRDLLLLGSVLRENKQLSGAESAINRAVQLFTLQNASFFVSKATSKMGVLKA